MKLLLNPEYKLGKQDKIPDLDCEQQELEVGQDTYWDAEERD